mmetsp:Transcript_21575/g.64694  ORF Transcript_21575/g.64694 Transcript_21575/m.64694 type:complete len:200 (-) Transcript_21575:1517-2116(-)
MCCAQAWRCAAAAAAPAGGVAPARLPAFMSRQRIVSANASVGAAAQGRRTVGRAVQSGSALASRQLHFLRTIRRVRAWALAAAGVQRARLAAADSISATAAVGTQLPAAEAACCAARALQRRRQVLVHNRRRQPWRCTDDRNAGHHQQAARGGGVPPRRSRRRWRHRLRVSAMRGAAAAAWRWWRGGACARGAVVHVCR